jgi:8-oxo-dGTP pyrophosphatase MutT (NUDIX family)
MSQVQLEQVHAALALADFDALAAQRQMAPQPRVLRRSTTLPGQPRQASVLVLLFPTDAGLTFVLTRRAEFPGDVHSGQISLPGGSREPGETPVQTAVRETQEELGLVDNIQILGSLTPLYIAPSDFQVQPLVGCIESYPLWHPDAAEVAEIVECPVSWLLDEKRKVTEDWDLNGYTLRVPWYNVHGHRVWGATAIILGEFEQRLRRILAE